MTRCLVVQADYPCGVGPRGYNLARFLRIYYGRRAVELVTTRDLLHARPRATDILFVGVPTQLRPQHLVRVTFRQAVLFDYLDEPGPIWGNSDRLFLLSLTDRYWKAWGERSWDFGLRMGLLPIKRHFRMTSCLWARRLWHGLLPNTARRRPYDVAFVGGATCLDPRFHQRIEWLREVQGACPGCRFWGGLILAESKRDALTKQFGDLGPLCCAARRLDYQDYFRRLCEARAALAPAGNAPWTYRHYEAIYAGAVPVCSDIRHVETLIPLPREGMVQVADHRPVLPAIARALRLREQHPELLARNVRFLERYLRCGDYSRSRPRLMDRFLAQLAG